MQLFTTFCFIVVVTGFAPVTLSWAADNDLDVTITVVDEGEDPESAFALIALPPQAAQTAVDNNENGINTANAVQQDGKESGEAATEAAKQKREAAKSSAKNAATQN